MPENNQITRLRQQMATLQPGVLEGVAESAAPLVSKLIGYAELVRAVMPKPRPAPVAPVPRPAPARPVVVVVRRPWRNRMIGAGLAVLAGALGFAAWRFRMLPSRRRVPMG